jgi:hypothetical protein
MKNLFFISALAAVFFSCEKDELPKPFSGNPSANTVQVSMGGDYANQLFFQLSSNSVVLMNNRESWDLGFECGTDGRQIILNSSKFMSMSKTESTDLAAVTSAAGSVWLYDSPSGKKDSAAFYNWELNKVYLIDRGNNTLGQPLGKMKMQIIAQDETSYTIRWGASISASQFQEATIQKSDDHNFSFFSFTTSQTVTVEPAKDGWDVCFTTYTSFPDGETAYLVTGLLTNRNAVRAYKSDIAFDDIDYGYASTVDYSADLDIIGYDWKVYDFDAATYVIDFSKVYVIKSVDGLYYKIRFLDFYDNMGVKGAPTFEVQELVP